MLDVIPELIKNWAAAVALAVIFGMVVSMLLPESSIKKYVSVVVGIVITIIILSPLISVLSGADVEAELMGALKSAGSSGPVLPETSSYKDYIYKVYEVYMGDG
ncbi:MAG: stage III sporulation protein AF [Christensenellales bacterium]|jgi:stage III sporulation protein AF